MFFVVLGFLEEGILMRKSFEAMTDITLDMLLAASTIERSRYKKRASVRLANLIPEIETYFGLGEKKLESWERYPVEQLLRSQFPDEGVHPVEGLKQRLENLKLVVNGAGNPAEATEFCLQLNRMFLTEWSSGSSRRSLAA